MRLRPIAPTAALAAVFGLALAGPVAAAMSPEQVAVYKGADRQKVLEDGAKKEGKVMVYSSMIVNQALRPLLESYMKKYPYVKAEYFRAETDALLQKILAERRANNVVGDVFEAGSGALVAMKANAVIPFYSVAWEEYPKELYEQKGMWASTRVAYFAVGYNTRQIPTGTAPKSYDELLDPKWKGKLAWRAGSDTGAQMFIANMILARGEKDGEAYLKKLSEQKIVNYGGSARALVDRVGEGEYAMALNIFAHHPIISKGVGAPLDTQLMDPVPNNINTGQIIRGAPHIHAAVLMMDFILGKEGQTVLRESEYLPAHPGVSPAGSIAQIVPRNSGVKEIVFGPEKIDETKEKADALFKKYFD
jgi:ABC-type Fe3+ transport system substrate-binding protein